MGGLGSGRKPLPDSGKRVRLCIEVAPRTYAGLHRMAHLQKTSIGRVLDTLWQSTVQKNTQ